MYRKMSFVGLLLAVLTLVSVRPSPEPPPKTIPNGTFFGKPVGFSVSYDTMTLWVENVAVCRFEVGSRAEVISHFPRVIHTDFVSVQFWLAANPNGRVAVGVKNGVVEIVILHPATEDD